MTKPQSQREQFFNKAWWENMALVIIGTHKYELQSIQDKQQYT